MGNSITIDLTVIILNILFRLILADVTMFTVDAQKWQHFNIGLIHLPEIRG